MKKYAVIVAGGSGSRMNSTIPKQFLTIHGKPVIMHTIDAFVNADSTINIILVLPSDAISTWNNLTRQYNSSVNVQTVVGGISRFHSVKNGINSIEVEEGLVAIHDGVRPLVSGEIINKSFKDAEEFGSAIVCTKLKESIRQIEEGTSRNIDRSTLRSIQTPQTFQLQLIRIAYNTFEDHTLFTDDASVLERYGREVHLIEGNYENIKITTPEDLILAEAILSNKKGQ